MDCSLNSADFIARKLASPFIVALIVLEGRLKSSHGCNPWVAAETTQEIRTLEGSTIEPPPGGPLQGPHGWFGYNPFRGLKPTATVGSPRWGSCWAVSATLGPDGGAKVTIHYTKKVSPNLTS